MPPYGIVKCFLPIQTFPYWALPIWLCRLHKPFSPYLISCWIREHQTSPLFTLGCLKEVYVNDKLVDFLQAAKTRHKVRYIYLLQSSLWYIYQTARVCFGLKNIVIIHLGTSAYQLGHNFYKYVLYQTWSKCTYYNLHWRIILSSEIFPGVSRLSALSWRTPAHGHSEGSLQGKQV